MLKTGSNSTFLFRLENIIAANIKHTQPVEVSILAVLPPSAASQEPHSPSQGEEPTMGWGKC